MLESIETFLAGQQGKELTSEITSTILALVADVVKHEVGMAEHAPAPALKDQTIPAGPQP